MLGILANFIKIFPFYGSDYPYFEMNITGNFRPDAIKHLFHLTPLILMPYSPGNLLFFPVPI